MDQASKSSSVRRIQPLAAGKPPAEADRGRLPPATLLAPDTLASLTLEGRAHIQQVHGLRMESALREKLPYSSGLHRAATFDACSLLVRPSSPVRNHRAIRPRIRTRMEGREVQ